MTRMYEEAAVNVLFGKTLVGVEKVDNDLIIFRTSDGEEYRMYHSQDCCESVAIEDICGSLDDLVGSPLLMAEEVSNSENPGPLDELDDSYTWTFFKFATVRGSVTIRWYGASNGYYSERVDFMRVE